MIQQTTYDKDTKNSADKTFSSAVLLIAKIVSVFNNSKIVSYICKKELRSQYVHFSKISS
jgi:hypothetical protein